ncbi:hypothetical protein ATN89_17255 [Comamonas thiooxydans]|uniref:cobaltochelatase CobT-related protein n=1 Tax=Comamonas thiooxydans TaxID=363952 RepID=UPI0007C42C4F|nr:hypothetical protein [Comamonas thiooxydans]OAD82831.1 hypothetical protein ATN89_17255 [Comamonas thiooxydans]
MSKHNVDVAVIRQAITKLVSLLTQKSIKVTQRGVDAFVEYDSRGNIKRMNIPFLADDAPIELIAAVQGFVDHEVGHVLDSDSRTLLKSVKKGSAVASLTNIIEDVYIEGCMTRRFAGSGENLDAVRRYMIAGAAEKVNSAIQAGDKGTATAYLMVHLLRAWGGQKLCREFISSNEPIKEIVAMLEVKIGHDLLAKVAAVSCSEESLKLAIEITDRIKSKDAEIARKAEKKKADEKKPPEKDKSEMTDSVEREAGGDDKPEPADEKPEPEPEPTEEPKPKPEPTEESEPDEEDAGKGSVTEPDQPPEDSEEAAAGASEEDSEEDPGEGSEAKTSVEEQERDQDDSTGSASTATTDEDLDEEESPPADGDGEHDDLDPDDAGMGDSSAGDDTMGAGEDTTDDTDPGTGDDESTSEAEDSEPAVAPSSLLPGTDGMPDDTPHAAGEVAEEDDEAEEELDLDKLFESTPISDDSMSEAISAAATSGAHGSKYMIFSQEFDQVEPLKSHAPDSVVAAMVSHVAPMIAPMAKSLQRALAAKDKVTWNPGLRRGRINPGALYRTSTGDDRVFRQRYATRAKNTAVTLLIDCSGSMRHENRIKSAAYAAFALSSTLERLKISHEVIGFTTTTDRQGEMLRAMRPDLDRDIFYPRSEPLYMPVFKGFEERLSFEQQSRIAYLLTYEAAYMLRENVDGESLRIAARRIANVKADRRIVLVLSDGSPACPCPDHATSEARSMAVAAAGGYPLTMDLINAVNEVTSSGIEVVGVGIQHVGVKRFYPKSINLARLSDLPTTVMDQLTTMLLA